MLVAALLLSACGSNGAPESTASETLPDPGRDFPVTTSDGLHLEARAWGTGADYVVLAHMRPADMTSWFDFARLLADHGYTAVAFNFRGYGQSEGHSGDFEVGIDVRAAVDAAHDAGAARVFVIGASMGGTGAVVAAASNEIAGTIALSAPDVFEGVDAASRAQDVPTPLLLIAADGDERAAEDAAKIAASNGQAELVILTGSQHGTNLFADHGEEITTLILDFLAAA